MIFQWLLLMNSRELRSINQMQRTLWELLQLSQDKIMMRLLNSTIFKERVASQIHQTQIFHISITVRMKKKSGLSKELFTIKRLSRTLGFQDRQDLTWIHLLHGGVKSLLCQLSTKERRWKDSTDNGIPDSVLKF